jgi:tetratricopeptide (TPR) repeat protein
VEGGYTPLKCKYLGDEVALRLRANDDGDPVIAGTKLLRQGAVAADSENEQEAEDAYLEAERLMPASAAPSYHLAHLCAATGRVDEGRKWYQRALALDPSYRTAYNSEGVLHFRDGHLRKAEKEHRRTLALNPHDAYAHLGLGLIALRRTRWKAAEASLREAISLDGNLLDAHRALGQLLARRGRRSEAILANESAMRLALAGHKPLNVPILTTDAGHARTYEDLASQYVLKAFVKAIKARRSRSSR